ncbi:MAG TPA: methylated-DNA--[protein]-cysteine S-methyltransferase [Candidatus Nanopelagicaceae bacterium]|nr:methylated-DNA--[protein]-cysteine S-methyltransferase [Candidatus Nanopelagicaceae bacterium]
MISAARPPDDSSWLAITERDRSAAFVYAVTTTGIYCRPGCPARRAQRRHVVTFPSSEAARAGGYRPCRRCHPDGAVSPGDTGLELVAGACAQIAAASGRVSLAELALVAGCSRSHLLRVFRNATGVTPGQYQAASRMRRASQLIATSATVTEAVYGAGYGSARGFYEGAQTALGMAPSTYRRGGAGVTIWYSCVDSKLGTLLVAATATGICAVEFGEDQPDLRLQRRFPAAELVWAPGRLEPLTKALCDHIEGRELLGSLPLDVPATAFQALVWAQLRRIPPGQTRSYQEVAAAVGAPKAARAVGRACSANPVALAIPCHRVVGANGSTGGYRWGLPRKLSLLATESELGSVAVSPGADDPSRHPEVDRKPSP